MSNTTPRAIRIPDDLWAAALAKADSNGDTVSEIVRKALSRYVKQKGAITVGEVTMTVPHNFNP